MHYFFLWGWVVCCVCCLGLVLVWVLVVCCVAAVVFVGVAGGLCEMVGDCVSAILVVAGGGEVLFWADLDEWVCEVAYNEKEEVEAYPSKLQL
jgi:hypothetical protein